MVPPYIVTGTLSQGRLVELDETIPLARMRVRVSIEPLPGEESRSLPDVLAAIRAQQQQRGYVAPSREEADRILAAERESWEG